MSISHGTKPRKRCLQTRHFLTVLAFFFVTLPAFSQLPPGARVIQIEMPDMQFAPSINDSRQVVFGGWTGATNRDIYLYEDGEVTQLTSGPLVNLGPVINNHGHIAWLRGLWDGNRDIFFDDGVKITQITDTPQQERSPVLNDSDQLAWPLETCGSGCVDMFFLPSLDSEAIQLTDGRARAAGARRPQAG